MRTLVEDLRTSSISSLLHGVTRSRHRAIGPIGTASRVAVGAIAIALPIVLGGLTWWDVGVAAVALPVAATTLRFLVTAWYERFAPDELGRSHAICSGPACALWSGLVAVGIALSVTTPANGVAIWVFVGGSMVVAAVRGYGGCELLAIPNAITRRTDQIGCVIFTPIDAAEARGRAHGSRGRAAFDL